MSSTLLSLLLLLLLLFLPFRKEKEKLRKCFTALLFISVRGIKQTPLPQIRNHLHTKDEEETNETLRTFNNITKRASINLILSIRQNKSSICVPIKSKKNKYSTWKVASHQIQFTMFVTLSNLRYSEPWNIANHCICHPYWMIINQVPKLSRQHLILC